MADFPPPEYYEAVRRHQRTITSLRIDTETRTATITLGAETTFTAKIENNPELLNLNVGDEVDVEHYLAREPIDIAAHLRRAREAVADMQRLGIK